MDKVLVEYSVPVLQLREAFNTAVLIFALVLCVLLGRYVTTEFLKDGYRGMAWPVKLSIGLFFIFAGELMHSSIVWRILHYEGISGTYLTDIGPLLFSLFLIILGALCVIRVMTPVRWGNTVWVGSLVVVLGLIAASRFL